MKYICRNHERKGSCWHELIAGPWDAKTFRHEDSLYLHDDIFVDFPEFRSLWLTAMPEFETCGINRMSRQQWTRLCSTAGIQGTECADFIREMTPWMENAFQGAEFVTILGI